MFTIIRCIRHQCVGVSCSCAFIRRVHSLVFVEFILLISVISNMSKGSSKMRKTNLFCEPSLYYVVKSGTETTTNKTIKVENETENEKWEVQSSNYDSSVSTDYHSSNLNDCQQLNDPQEKKYFDPEHLNEKQVIEIQMDNVSQIGLSDLSHTYLVISQHNQFRKITYNLKLEKNEDNSVRDG